MHDKLFIAGQWVPAIEGKTFDVINPATETVIQKCAAATAKDVDVAIKVSHEALKTWKKTTGAQRAKFLRDISAELLKRKDELARLETSNNGKTLQESTCDVDDTAACFSYYADLAEELDKRQNKPLTNIPDQRFAVNIKYEPIGVVAAIIPFNYPLMMAAWKVAPALAAGCTINLKPSEYTPLTALELAAIAQHVGLPSGVLNVITGFGQEAGEPLVRHPLVNKVAFTGSVPTGSKLAAIAGQEVKNITLELGGKSPIIIFDDVPDLTQAVEWIMFGIFVNQGQVCSATSRLLVQDSIAPKLLERLKEEAAKIKVGDGTQEGVMMGPLVSYPQYRRVIQYINKGLQENCKLLTGGPDKPAGLMKGYYVQPTIFVDVPTTATIWKEEIFGPVLAVSTFKTEDEAIHMANDSQYGLAAAVMSKDQDRTRRVSEALEAGIMYVNCSQPCFCQAPWGGCKKSGVGRELGPWGLDNYLHIKQVATMCDPTQPWGWFIK